MPNRLQFLRIVTAVHDDILTAAGGQHLTLAGLIPNGGHETLAQPFPIGILQGVHIAADAVPLQNGGDLLRTDSGLRGQPVQDFPLGIRREAGRRRTFLLFHRVGSSFFGFFTTADSCIACARFLP